MLDRFKGKKILIAGDVMVDAYIIGKVERLSPEAPVPVVNIERHEHRLGGAANVALNILSLGAEPILCTVIGNDPEAEDFLKILREKNLTTSGLVVSDNRKTTTKTRVLGNQHQLLRIDNEVLDDLKDSENERFLDTYKANLEDCDVVILEDYNKGVLTEQNIPILIDLANKSGKPVVVDPKKKNFLCYKNVTLFKPNLKELREGLNTQLNLKNKEDLIQATKELNGLLNNQMTMVTLSEDGVMISDHQQFDFIPAHYRNISDVSGAGDTVIGVAALSIASGFDMKLLAELSNLAGGLVCEESGVVPISPQKLQKESAYLFSNTTS